MTRTRTGAWSRRKGVQQPVDSAILIRFEFVEPNTKGRGARSFLGVDGVRSSDADQKE